MDCLRIVLCGMLAASGLCASDVASCPETIDVHQELTAAVPGFQSTLSDTPVRLASVAFYDSPPAEKVSLANERTVKLTGKEKAIWRFTVQPNHEIWMSCGYSGTSVLLIRPLPPKTDTCSVTYNVRQRVAGLPVIEAIACSAAKQNQ